MSETTATQFADPACPDCHGSGIDPDSRPMYHDGAPSIPDPAGYEPCDCVLRSWHEPREDRPETAAAWLVFSHEHSAWWKPRRWGYTDLTSQAGRYTETDTREICETAAYRWHRGAGGPKALPPEVMVRADAEDHYAAICAATEDAVSAREAADSGRVETVRLEVALRKVAGR